MPISCNLYDTIEIVCMYHYPVTLTLCDKTQISGVALDTKRNDERLECIELRVDDIATLVVLSSLKTMTVDIENPHFQSVSF